MDNSYLSVSNCCGANSDYNMPMEIRVIDNDGDYSADHNNVGANTQTNLVITFSLTYQA